MSRSIDEILDTKSISRADLDELFAQFDADGSGQLERAELEALAALLAKRMPQTSAAELLAILDFYEVDRDGKFSRDELMAFLQIQLDL